MSFTSSPTDVILLVEIQVEITRPVLGSSKKSSKTDRRLKVYDFHWEHEDHLRYLMQRDNCIVGERLGRVSKVPLETRLKTVYMAFHPNRTGPNHADVVELLELFD